MASANDPRASLEGLEEAIYKRVLKNLEDPLAKIVHGAVHSAIVHAAEPQADEAPAPKFSRPAAGGRCSQIWDMLDKVSSERGEAPSLQEVRKLAKRRHWNGNTARIQYYRWRAATQSQVAA